MTPAGDYAKQANMSVEEIEMAVSKLASKPLAKFRAWFEAFDAARFDEKIERDVKSGKLNKLAEQAQARFDKSDVREI